MLSDNIADGLSSAVSTAGRFAGAAIRGALLFGFIAFAAVALWSVILPAMGAAWTAGSAGAFFTSAFSNASWGILATTAAQAAWIGGAIGAAVLATTSLIPGKEQGYGLKSPSAAPDQSASVSQGVDRQPQMNTSIENPGATTDHVAKLMQQRTAAAANTSLSRAADAHVMN